MIRGGLILTTGNLAAALLSLVRNIIIARLISVEDFGIASTFAITMALVEMASNFSLDRLLVQARDGDELHFLSTLHAVQAIRGLLGGAILFAAAGPIAALFGVPEVAWAYQALGLVPLLRGLAHLDMFRRQRVWEFIPSVTVEAAAQLLATLAALPLALGLGDWRAMLCAILIQQVVFTSASHWVTVRPYRWDWDHDVIRRTLRFGWPLLLNGFLMFGIFQGDRLIVGSLVGMVELGWFSAAFMFTMVPAMVLTNTLRAFLLPTLANVQDDPARFRVLFLVTVQAALLIGVVFAAAFATIGPALFIALFGSKFEPALSVLVLLAIMQAFRLAKAGPIIVAMAKAETKNALVANLLRGLTLIIAWVAVAHGAGIQSVVTLGIIGEGLGLAVGLAMLRSRIVKALGGALAPCAASVTILALIFQGAVYRPPNPDGLWHIGIVQIMLLIAAVASLGTMAELRKWLREVVGERPRNQVR